MFRLPRTLRTPGPFSTANDSSGGGSTPDPAYLADFRTYAAGDVPPGLFPWQFDGIAYLYDPRPLAITFQ